MFGQMVERHDGEPPRAVMLLPALGSYDTVRVPVGLEHGGPGEGARVMLVGPVVLDPTEAVRFAFALLARVKRDPVCSVCGCSDACACPGGCYWHEVDLCSVCASKRQAAVDAVPADDAHGRERLSESVMRQLSEAELAGHVDEGSGHTAEATS